MFNPFDAKRARKQAADTQKCATSPKKDQPSRRGRKRKAASEVSTSAKKSRTTSVSIDKGVNQCVSKRAAKGQSVVTLDDSTRQVLRLLQHRGRISLKDLKGALGIDSRRGYDILNVLRNTPLLDKSPNRQQLGYLFLGEGQPLTEGECDVDNLLTDLEAEACAIEDLITRIGIVEQACREEQRPNLDTLWPLKDMTRGNGVKALKSPLLLQKEE